MEFKEAVVAQSRQVHTQSRRKRLPAAEQQHFVALWQQSGLSCKSFCDKHFIRPKTFANWKKKYANTQCHQSHEKKPKKERHPIKWGAIKLQLPNGISVMLNMETESVFSFLSVIKEVATWNYN